MINTVNTKAEQLRNGCFEIGSGPEKVLIVGSCRSVPYVTYMKRANEANGNRFTIRFLDPFNWNWNERDERVDFEAKINSLETDPRILEILRSTDIYIHEWYESFGMFNSSKDSPKNIYQFGLNPKLDICIPNFNDKFILWNDFALFGPVPEDWVSRGKAAVDKFCDMCALSSFPEMGEYFRAQWKTTRLFWTSNHITSAFSLYVFRRMNEKFLNLPLAADFWNAVHAEPDIFAFPHTIATDRDAHAYGITWKD